MSLRDQYEQAVRVQRENHQQAQLRYQEESRRRLGQIIRTKMTTSAVGAVSLCEEILGELWGHGLSAEQRTEEQRRWYRRWRILREAILSNGNKQLRALEKELAQYLVVWLRYQTQLRVVSPETPDVTAGTGISHERSTKQDQVHDRERQQEG